MREYKVGLRGGALTLCSQMQGVKASSFVRQVSPRLSKSDLRAQRLKWARSLWGLRLVQTSLAS